MLYKLLHEDRRKVFNEDMETIHRERFPNAMKQEWTALKPARDSSEQPRHSVQHWLASFHNIVFLLFENDLLPWHLLQYMALCLLIWINCNVSATLLTNMPILTDMQYLKSNGASILPEYISGYCVPRIAMLLLSNIFLAFQADTSV